MSIKSEFVRKEANEIVNEISGSIEEFERLSDRVFLIRRRLDLLLHEVEAIERMTNGD